MVRDINVLCDQNKVSREEAQDVLQFLRLVNTVLDVLPVDTETLSIPEELEAALEKRQLARAEKRWKEADEWRDFIHERGYVIEDTPSGARLKKQTANTLGS